MSALRMLLSLLLLCSVATINAETTDPAADGAAPAKHHGDGLRGEISAIDAAAKTITITPKGDDAKPVILTVDDATKISIDRKPATFADLKVGDKAMAQAKDTTATRIGVRRTAGDPSHGGDAGQGKGEGAPASGAPASSDK